MATMPRPRSEAFASTLAARVGRFRWTICALLFFAATINYIDRQVIGILKPTLQTTFGWSEIDYSDIVFAFQLAYALGFMFAGRLMDRLGTRTGFALALVVWSLAAMAHAWATAFGPAVRVVLAAVGLTSSVETTACRSSSSVRPWSRFTCLPTSAASEAAGSHAL